MSDTMEGLRRKIDGAAELRSVVRTMKALAASSIAQYERSVSALQRYERTVELALGVALRQRAARVQIGEPQASLPAAGQSQVAAVVFGSDQGLVGQFNDVLAAQAAATLRKLTGSPRVWAVGERIQAQLIAEGLLVAGLFAVPGSVAAITPLIGQILLKTDPVAEPGPGTQLHLFYNRPTAGAGYEPVSQQLLPLDAAWQRARMALPWPTTTLPEVLAAGTATLEALIGDYLFVLLFRACAASLASENASRLAAMQRAEKSIDELSSDLSATFHRLRQSSIDEELFDVVAGFEAQLT